MTPEQARDTVRAALLRIAPDVEWDTLDATADLREAADLDSLDFQAFVAELGRAAGVTVSEEESQQLSTAAACADFLTRSRVS